MTDLEINPALEELHQRFPSFVVEVLRQAQWFPGREVDATKLEEWYVVKWNIPGCYSRIFPAALRVLREFGGLFVEPNAVGSNCHRDSFLLDPLPGVESGMWDHNWFIDEWLVESPLFPIGHVGEQPDYTLAMDPQGRVLGLGYGFHLIGGTFDEALINLIEGHAPVLLDIPNRKRKEVEAAQLLPVTYRQIGGR